MERFNGEVRDREKVMSGLKRKDTLILTGYQPSCFIQGIKLHVYFVGTISYLIFFSEFCIKVSHLFSPSISIPLVICTKDIDAARRVNERPVIAFCYCINSQFVVSECLCITMRI